MSIKKEIQIELDLEIDTIELEKYMTKPQIQAYIYVICKHINDRYSGKKVDNYFLIKLANFTMKEFNIPTGVLEPVNDKIVNYMVEEKRKLRKQLVRKEKLQRLDNLEK